MLFCNHDFLSFNFFCHASCICFVSGGGGDGGSPMATGGAASSSGTFCVSQSSFSCQIWLPGQATNRSLPSNLLPNQSLQAKVGVMKCPTACFCDGLKPFFVPNSCDFVCTWPWLHLHHTIFYNHDLAGTKESKSSSSRSSSSEGKGEGTESSDGGRPEMPAQPNGARPKAKGSGKAAQRSLCQLHSTSGMAKKMKMKTLPGCRLWRVGSGKKTK